MNVLKLDDPLDAFSVHGANGVLGMIAAAAFATESGLAGVYHGSQITTANASGFLVGGGFTLLGANMTAIAATAVWVVFTIVPFFLLVKSLRRFGVKLRVDPAAEVAGLDIADHGGPAYVECQSLEEQAEVFNGSAFAISTSVRSTRPPLHHRGVCEE